MWKSSILCILVLIYYQMVAAIQNNSDLDAGSVFDKHRLMVGANRVKRSELLPIGDQNRDDVQRDALNVQKNCTRDNVCIPDLHLDVKTVDKFLFISEAPLEIEVFIANNGEDAFGASFFMTLPNDLYFKRVKLPDASNEDRITCFTRDYTLLRCDIGDPFMAGKTINFIILLTPILRARMAASYDFYMEVNSTNPEKEGAQLDNVVKKRINVWIKTDIVVEGLSRPAAEHYKASDYKALGDATSENELGPQVVQIYNVWNKGQSTIKEAVLYVHWPYQTLGGQTLMYIMNSPQLSGNIQCEPNSFINVNKLDVDYSLASKNYLELNGISIRPFNNRYQFDEPFEDPSASNDTKISTENFELCRTAKCQTFRCIISDLVANDEAWFAIEARLVAKTLESLALENRPINVSTVAALQVTKLPYIGRPSEDIIRSHEVIFKAIPEPTLPPLFYPNNRLPEEPSRTTPVELQAENRHIENSTEIVTATTRVPTTHKVILSALVCTVIVLLLLLLLVYKCGVCKRNRPQPNNLQEELPLNLRNGRQSLYN